MKRSLVILALLSGLLVCEVFGQATLRRTDAIGGGVTSPVVHGNYMYIGTGVTVTVWNMADPTHPALVGRTKRYPERAPIVGLALIGKYLYAGWSGGISIYSLSDPANPVRVSTFNKYVKSSFKQMTGLTSAGSHIYLGDANNGLIVVDASHPLALKTVSVTSGIYEFDTMAAYGTRLLTSGTSFIGDRLVHVIDVSSPAAPVELGYLSLDGSKILRAVLTPDYAIAVGLNLQVYDLRNPAHIVKVFGARISEADHAIRHGNVLYLAGKNGIQVWDFSKPAAAKLLRTVPMNSFAPDVAANTPFGPVFLTHLDRGLVLGIRDPRNPVLAGQFTIPFGVAANAAAFDSEHTYVAEEAYGLAALESKDLSEDGRFNTTLPRDLSQRDMDNVSVDSGRAYLAAWGYGVLIVDLSDPSHPSELGRLPYPFPAAIQARGNLAYVASATNDGVFSVLDVSDPKNASVLGSLATAQILDLTVRGRYAYLAGRSFSVPGGLTIVDVSNPSAPLQAGQNTDCADAYGVDVSPNNKITYIACADGSFDILDTSDKTNPVTLGRLALPGTQAPAVYSVTVAGATAYVGNDYGVDEVDVSDPKNPVQIVRHPTGFPVRRLSKSPDGRIFAFTGLAGAYEYTPVASATSAGSPQQ